MKERSYAAPMVVLLMVLPLVYVGSYLALVVPRGVEINNEFGYYRLQSQQCRRIYWPLEQIDRRLRPWARQRY